MNQDQPMTIDDVKMITGELYLNNYSLNNKIEVLTKQLELLNAQVQERDKKISDLVALLPPEENPQ